jgi:four helix bundle protein
VPNAARSSNGTGSALPKRMRGVRHFTQLRAWQLCDAYKRAIYKLTEMPCYQKDSWRRAQLEKSVAGPPAHIAEGFGRFNPPEFAHYTSMAHGSLMESKNHLMDAVDKRYITTEAKDSLIGQADAALAEVSGLLDYLKSAEARRNALRAQQRREIRRGTRPPNPNPNPEPEPEP